MIQHIKNPIIEIHDLTVSYAYKPVLWDVDITLPPGKRIAIIGPNGAGKSTLLKSIMGLIPLDSGYVKLFGQNIDKVRKKISYVPQRESVDWDFPASVYEVAMMGRYVHMGLLKRPGQIDKDKVIESLKQLGIESLAHRQISQLSGGQQQRIFLARALAQDAQIYFMDEPLKSIDAPTETIILQTLKQMTNQGKTVVVVHHDLPSVQAHFDWSVLLNKYIIASGPTKEVLTPPLLQKTYGKQLTILGKIHHLMKKQEVPAREKN